MVDLLGRIWHYLYPLVVAVSAILLNELLKDLGVDVYGFIKKLFVRHAKTLKILSSKSTIDIRTSGFTKLTPNDLDITIPFSYHNGSDEQITVDDERIVYVNEAPRGLSAPLLNRLNEKAIGKNSTVKTSFSCRINLDNFRVDSLTQAMTNYLEILQEMPEAIEYRIAVQYYLGGKSYNSDTVLAIPLRTELVRSWLAFLTDNPYTGPEHEYRDQIIAKLHELANLDSPHA